MRHRYIAFITGSHQYIKHHYSVTLHRCSYYHHYYTRSPLLQLQPYHIYNHQNIQFCCLSMIAGDGGGRSSNKSGRERKRKGGRGRGGRGNNNSYNRRRQGGRKRRTRSPPSPIPSLGQAGRECHRSCINPGIDVYIVKKEDQRSGKETIGTVSRLLTKSAYHPRGIKVMLDNGIVGRVTRFIVKGAEDTENVQQESKQYES